MHIYEYPIQGVAYISQLFVFVCFNSCVINSNVPPVLTAVIHSVQTLGSYPVSVFMHALPCFAYYILFCASAYHFTDSTNCMQVWPF